MKLRLITLALLAGFLFGCQVQESTNYANLLENCLDNKDILLLNRLTHNFEKHIQSTYSLSVSEAYRKYLQNVAEFNFPSNLFNYSTFKSDLSELRSSNFFKTQMVRQSSIQIEGELTEIPPSDGDQNVEVDLGPMTFKPSGEYLKCLISLNKVEAINDYLEIVNQDHDISPSLLAQALKDKLKNEDFETPLVRLIIAINFHYDFSLMLTDN